MKMAAKTENICLLPVIITGKNGEYFCYPLGNENQSPLISISVNKTPLLPYNHIVIEEILGNQGHVIASVDNLKESDVVAYNCMVEKLAFFIGNQLIDIYHNRGAVCWFLANDKTPHKNPQTLEAIISHLKERKESDENMFSSNSIESYETSVKSKTALS